MQQQLSSSCFLQPPPVCHAAAAAFTHGLAAAAFSRVSHYAEEKWRRGGGIASEDDCGKIRARLLFFPTWKILASLIPNCWRIIFLLFSKKQR